MPGFRRRRPEVRLPLLRQEVHLPHRHRPRELPNAALHLGLLHQAHAPQRPRRVRGRTVRRHHKTAFEWHHRVLAAVYGYQDRIVLRATVWVDETYISDTDLSKGYAGRRASAA